MKELLRRTVPVLVGDINEGFGLVKGEDGGWKIRSDRWICAARTEREHLAARLLRPVLMEFDLCSVSAARLESPTFFGPKSNSVIDHFFVPVEAVQAVQRVTTLRRSMRVLQLVRTKEPRDHAPVAMTLRLSDLHPPHVVHPRVCPDQMMEALTYGHRREDYLRRLEDAIKEVDEEEWREEEARMTTDGHWEKIAKAVQRAAQQAFSQKHPERMQLSERRKELLSERRRLRMRLSEVDEDEMETVRLELTLVARRTTRIRKRGAAERRALVLDDIRDAWRRRRFHLMYKHLAKLAGNRRAPRRRVYAAPPATEPDLEVWDDFLQLRGFEGGLAAARTGPAELAQAHFERVSNEGDEAFPWLQAEGWAREDEWRIAQRLSSAGRRRTWPAWGAPAGEVQRRRRSWCGVGGSGVRQALLPLPDAHQGDGEHPLVLEPLSRIHDRQGQPQERASGTMHDPCLRPDVARLVRQPPSASRGRS